MSNKRTQLIAELEGCKDRNGRITKKAIVVEARRNRKSELYRKFKARGLWNDKLAAGMARLEFAGELMRRYLTIQVIHRNVKVSSVAYTRDPLLPHNVSGSRRLVDYDQQSAELVVAQEIASCEAIVRRARAVASVLDVRFPGLLDRLESALEMLIAARTELHRKAA